MAQGHFLSDIYRSDKLYHDLYKKAKDIDTAAQLFVNDNNLLTSSTNIQVVQSLRYWYSYTLTVVLCARKIINMRIHFGLRGLTLVYQYGVLTKLWS